MLRNPTPGLSVFFFDNIFYQSEMIMHTHSHSRQVQSKYKIRSKDQLSDAAQTQLKEPKGLLFALSCVWSLDILWTIREDHAVI